MKKYNITITSDTGEELLNEDFENLMLIGKCDDGKLAECLMNVDMIEMAIMLCSTKKTKHAMKLAHTFMEIKSDMDTGIESDLVDQIMGGNE